MSETTNTSAELTDEDLAAIQASLDEGTEAVTRRSVLEIWHELFSNVETVAKERVTPGLAMNIVSTWPKLSVQDTPRYHAIYHELLGQARDILDLEVLPEGEARDLAFARTGDDDADLNEDLYNTLLLEWQKLVIRWENTWDAAHPEAHITAAVIADVHKFILSGSGIVEYLSQIGFRYTDEMKAAHAEELEAFLSELAEAVPGE